LGTGATASSELAAGASVKSGTRLVSTSEEMSEFSGKKSPRASKESVMFFLTNHLRATLLAREQETPPPLVRKASFMVNKTSTIKRICGSGAEPA
jgi:hypothetical protein